MPKRVQVLLVEDSPAEETLLREFLVKYLTVPYRLSVVHDGEAALAFLHHHPPYPDAPRPHLIILDLHLPKIDGWEVLAAIKAAPSLAAIPVVIFTGSAHPADHEKSAALQPALYLVKPDTLEQYRSVVTALEECLRRHIAFARGEGRTPASAASSHMPPNP